MEEAITPPETPIPAPTRPGLSGGRVPVRLAWSGADDRSGIARYEIARRTDGGAWFGPTNAATPNLSVALGSGHTYQFRVRAIDGAGNVSGWAEGAAFRLAAVSQSNAAVRYAGTWATSTSTIWWGGTARRSSRAGSTVSYRFTGRAIAWVGLKGVGRGRANIYVNGVWKATLDLYSATTLRQRIVWSATYEASATRTITIKVLGTAVRPPVDVDGFVLSS